MPVFDTKIFMGEEQRESWIQQRIIRGMEIPIRIGQLKRVILFTFFKKPMAREVTMLRRSAMPSNIVNATVASEFLRRMKNTSRDLTPNRIEEVLSKYCK